LCRTFAESRNKEVKCDGRARIAAEAGWAVYRIRVVEKERNETLDRIKQLEREAGELRQLISTAEAKADEILKAS